MLIALLAVLGVDLIVLVVFAVLVVGRRRWLKRQPGEFAREPLFDVVGLGQPSVGDHGEERSRGEPSGVGLIPRG